MDGDKTCRFTDRCSEVASGAEGAVEDEASEAMMWPIGHATQSATRQLRLIVRVKGVVVYAQEDDGHVTVSFVDGEI